MEILAPIAGLHFQPFYVIGMGAFAGFFAGMVGLGGGLILVPFLILYGVPPNVATATANCYMVSTASSGLYSYRTSRQVHTKIGLYLIIGSLLGSIFGVSLVKMLLGLGKADPMIKVSFSIITGLIGLFMLWDAFHSKKEKERRGEGRGKSWYTLWVVVFCGMVAGISSSVLGVAGGIFIVPLLLYFVQLDAHTAVGTSLMHILFTTAVVSVLHSFHNQNLDVVLAFFLVLGSGAGAQLGAYCSKKSSARVIKGVFAAIALAGSFRLWMQLSTEGVEQVRRVLEYPAFARQLLELSTTHPLGYGLLSVLMALGLGLAWGRVFAAGQGFFMFSRKEK